MVARMRSTGAMIGRVAAAFATIPVPITDANQFGVMFENACAGCTRSRRSNRRDATGAGERVTDFMLPDCRSSRSSATGLRL